MNSQNPYNEDNRKNNGIVESALFSEDPNEAVKEVLR